MSRKNYDLMRRSFSHKMDLDSLYVVTRRLSILSGIKAQLYDCCVNSCVCYTLEFSLLDGCPYCKEPRRSSDGKPRRCFSYLPLIPRLQALFSNRAVRDDLDYRPQYIYEASTIRDVFDASCYAQLQDTYVVADDKVLGHKFFSDDRDIAFGVCTDGFLLFGRHRGGPSATPLLVKVYSLPPSTRTRLENLFCLGVIPGPRQPKDLRSFLAPLDAERVRLAQGVSCYDIRTDSIFLLHAYHLFQEGDILALEKFIGLKGHSSQCPCRSCLIHGRRMAEGMNKVYYVPLTHPTVDDNTPVRKWHIPDIPRRTHASILHGLCRISEAVTQKSRKQLEKHYGLKHEPALTRVNSLDYGRSCPWEWLHLFAENLIPNLLDIWMGKFKGTDEGTGDYEISQAIWQEIGQETVCAVKTIPSAFVRSMGNILTERATYTAESYAFWFMYLAPHLLAGRFDNVEYYQHAMDLVDIMKITLQYAITLEEIDSLEKKCWKWVEDYERYIFFTTAPCHLLTRFQVILPV